MQAEKIAGIKYLGKQQTYDIEIDSDDHIFYGNGIATSNSHSVGYGYLSYLTAYAKTHYPKEFFTAYLKFAHNSIDPKREIYELVNNANSMGINIYPPNIKLLNNEFDLIDGKILFGLCDIKSVGQSVIDKLLLTIKESEQIINKPFKDWTWTEFLILAIPNIKKDSLENMINVGACDCFGLSRIKMLFETNIVREFSARELKWIVENCIGYNGLEDILFKMTSDKPGQKAACANINRFKKVEGFIVNLKNTPYEMSDAPHQVAMSEYDLLGVSITANVLDECKYKYKANCTCEEYNTGFGKDGNNVAIAGQVNFIKKIKTKKGLNPGQEMAFIEISDSTGTIDSIVAFPEVWEEYKNMIIEGNRLLLCGKRDYKKKDSFILELVEQL